MARKLRRETVFNAWIALLIAALVGAVLFICAPASAADDKPIVLISGNLQSIPAADRLVDGSGSPYLVSGGSGYVTSVGLSMPLEFSCTGSPITSSGTFTCSWVSETANKVFAAPNGAPGTPSFRLLVAADIPALSYVTSVAQTVPAEFSVSGSPITSAGTLAITKAAESANLVWAGPSSGAAAQPTFRALVNADMPGSGAGSGTVTSVTSANGDITVANTTTTPVLTAVSAPKWDTGRTLSITGDLAYTSPSFDGSANVTAAGTLATVNANVGSFGDATHAGQFTVNGKGLITAAASVLVVPGANTITRAMMAQAAANTMLGNWTGSTANVADNAMPSCSDTSGNHLNYVSGTGITCGTSDSHVGTVTSVAETVPAEFSIAGSPITSSGTLAISKATQSANTIWAGPTSGAAAAPTFRAMVAADCVLPTASTVGCIQSKAAVASNFLTAISTGGVVSAAQPAFTDISGTAAASQGGTGVASPTAHNLVVAEGASAMTPIAPGAAGRIPVSQGAAADPAFETVSGDATLASGGALTVTTLNGVAPGALYPLGAGNGVQVNGSSLQANMGNAPILIPVVGTLTLANSDCGSSVQTGSAGGTLAVTLPASPPASCQFGFITNGQAATVNPNGNAIVVFNQNYTSALLIPAATGTGGTVNPGQLWATSIQWNGTRWQIVTAAPRFLEAIESMTAQDPTLAHGQVYFSLTGSTLQLCPYNGPGGLIVAHYMRVIPPCNGSTSFGAVLPNTATTGSSVLNYIYAVQIQAAITSYDNTGCNGRVTVGNETGMQPNDTITIHNAAITTEANATFLIASIPDATHICLSGITFTHTGADGGVAVGVGLTASATGHVTDTSSVTNGANDNIEVLSSNGRSTLVGIVYVAASQTLNDSATKRDVVSWFNRQRRKMIVQEATGTGTTVSAATGAGTFKTLNTVIEGEFVIAGPPSLPGTFPVNATEWHVIALVSDGGANGVCALGATFNTAAQAGNAAVTGELEVAAATIGVTVTDQEDALHASGLATGLTEGREFIDIAGWNTALNPCGLNGGLAPTTLEAFVWQ